MTDGSGERPRDDDPLRVVVIGDSTSFTDATGPQLPDHPDLYPNVLGRHLRAALRQDVEVTVIARAGHTVREAVRTVMKDRHVQFDVLAGADAVVIGIGSFDHAPGGVPPVVEAMVPYLHHDGLRRTVRRALRAAYPWLVGLTGGRRHRTAAKTFDRLFVLLLEHVRGLTWGRAAGVVLGPTSHRAAYYGNRHPLHGSSEIRHLTLARAHGFAAVPAWTHVLPHVDELNPDGIHWPAAAHADIGAALAAALVPQLIGDVDRIGLPDMARTELGLPGHG